jgi:hypothetical protein
MNLELKEFDGGIMCRCEIDLLQEMQRKIDRKLEADGEKALEIALASRGYFKKRTCEVAGVYTYGDSDEYREYALSCGHVFKWNDEEPPNYCPECGAKVVEG